MAKYRVTWVAKTFASDEVELPDEYSDPMEESFINGYPTLCAQCSGWRQGYDLELPEDSACWEFVDAVLVDEREQD